MFKNLLKAKVIAVSAVILSIIGVGFLTNSVSSRQVVSFNDGELWRDADESLLASSDERQIVPLSYRTVTLNKDALQTLLRQAPLESKTSAANSEMIISLPLPDGRFSRFRFVESPTMEAALQAQYPDIRTYLGQGIDAPEATTKFDFTPKGFHALILSEGDSVYIDPYSKNNTDNYIAYYKRDLPKGDRSFMCEVPDSVPNALEKKHLDDKLSSEELVNNAGTLRTYRLAMAATGEYTAFHGGTVAGAMAAIVTTMNRVNGVYERDLSVRMNLVANNNLIIYTNATTDPYTNTSNDLPNNQANLTAVIGAANYDIGHLVGTGGGGIASLNSPCNASTKAQGLTGSPAPVGDPFDIDYVAHEMGHQFGGNHTFNANGAAAGSCNGNRSSTAAFEPGSASTIQGYAGICDGQDLQRNSDDYFHIRSLEEMVAFISNNATGGSCDIPSASGNTVPVVTDAADCTIPQDTPFELTGSATDVNNDALTYTWEEYDLGTAATAIPNTDATGMIPRPVFRSYRPTTGGSTRSFPSLPFILNDNNIPPSTFTGTNSVGTVCAFGTCMTGERLPTVNRTMQFQLTARDNRAGGGGVRSAQTAVTVVETNAGNTFGPFAVTAPNTATSYNGGTNQTVTWNAANTTLAPVSCANVNILLSTDGGATFPTTLAAGTANDGTESVFIPNSGTSTARIKIKCATSCFFDVSNANFSILPALAATASIGGKVTAAEGRGIAGAIIQLTDSAGNTRLARTGSFGYFNFSELEVGQTYTLTVSHKRHTFAQPTQIITLSEDFAEADFTAE